MAVARVRDGVVYMPDGSSFPVASSTVKCQMLTPPMPMPDGTMEIMVRLAGDSKTTRIILQRRAGDPGLSHGVIPIEGLNVPPDPAHEKEMKAAGLGSPDDVEGIKHPFG